MFTYQSKIKLHETDAAGLLFFANQFKMIHDAYECVLEQIGFGFADLIANNTFFLPIVHAESDYKKPLFVGDVIEIQVTLAAVGKTSFTFSYDILNAKQELVGTAKTVHVTMDKATQKKIPLPEKMREQIDKLYKEDNS